MSYQDYHGHSFEASFRKISCGLQGLEVFQTIPQEATTPEKLLWQVGNRERFEMSIAALDSCLIKYNALDYRWRRRECKVIEVRTGKVRYVSIYDQYGWEADNFVYAKKFQYHRRIQRAIFAMDAPRILTDPTYRLRDSMRRAGIFYGTSRQWGNDVYDVMLEKLEAAATDAQRLFLTKHFPWLVD